MNPDDQVAGSIAPAPAAPAGEVVGVIAPAVLTDPNAKGPVFRVLQPWERDQADKQATCPHPTWTLDKKNRLVFCVECKLPIDSFQLLVHYADWWERIEQQKFDHDQACRALFRDILHALKRKVCFTDGERQEMEALIRASHVIGHGSETTDDLRAHVRRFEKLDNERGWVRRGYRRSPDGRGWEKVPT